MRKKEMDKEKEKEDEIHNAHDKGYKYLLSIKRLFVQLLRCFVQEGWAQRIQQEDIELVDKSFILQDFREKESDLVYKIKMDDNYVFFYLLELQSSVDHQMPYRLLLYMVEIWRMVLKEVDSEEAKRIDFKLPVIVPCVLYNGVYSWTAVRSFRETLARHEEFGEFVLDFKYILFDVRNYDDKALLEMANVIGSVFFIDKTSEKSNEILKRLKMIAQRTKDMSEDDINVFWIWLKNIVGRKLSNDEVDEMEEIFQKGKKVEDMEYALERAMKKERMDAKEEGIEEGIEKGIEKGREAEQIEIAKKMLLKELGIEIISETTGLSIDKIKELQK